MKNNPTKESFHWEFEKGDEIMTNIEIGFLNKEKIVVKYRDEFHEFAKRYASDSTILVLSDTVIEKAQVNYIRIFE